MGKHETMSTVSVHIVTFHSGAWIRQCLEAVFKQSYPVERVIVVDNASRDNTMEILDDFARRYERLQVVANAENVGFAAAHNQAMRMSSCDYYLVLNPDVTLHEDYLKHIIRYMDEHPQFGSATGKLVRRSNPAVIDSTGLSIRKNRRCVDRGANEPLDAWNERSEVFGVSGAAAVYARRMVQDVSIDGRFFDESFFAYKEDVDVAWRAQWRGWGAVYIPEALGFHERGWKEGERRKQPLFVRKHSYINRYRMIIKNDSLRYAWKHAVPILLFEGASLVYHLLREPQVLSAWRALWRDRTRLLQQRRWIQQRKKADDASVYRFFE